MAELHIEQSLLTFSLLFCHWTTLLVQLHWERVSWVLLICQRKVLNVVRIFPLFKKGKECVRKHIC